MYTGRTRCGAICNGLNTVCVMTTLCCALGGTGASGYSPVSALVVYLFYLFCVFGMRSLQMILWCDAFPPSVVPETLTPACIFFLGILFSVKGFCGGMMDAISNVVISAVHGADVAPWTQVVSSHPH